MGLSSHTHSTILKPMATAKKAVPKHVELREKLRGRFQRMSPNAMIPSARDLAKSYKVSAMTVRQALVALQQEGMIHSVPGLGTFISDHKMSKRLTFVSFSQEVIERGMKPSAKIVSAIKTKISDETLAEQLQLKVGDPIYKIERVRFADKIPMALEQSCISAELMPGLLDQDLNTSLYEIFKNTYEKPVTRAECVVSPVNLNKRQADLLETEFKSAALNFVVIAYDARGRALERCSSIKHGDRYDFKYSIQAES
jgi:GntR family transcriptional regulator